MFHDSNKGKKYRDLIKIKQNNSKWSRHYCEADNISKRVSVCLKKKKIKCLASQHEIFSVFVVVAVVQASICSFSVALIDILCTIIKMSHPKNLQQLGRLLENVSCMYFWEIRCVRRADDRKKKQQWQRWDCFTCFVLHIRTAPKIRLFYYNNNYGVVGAACFHTDNCVWWLHKYNYNCVRIIGSLTQNVSSAFPFSVLIWFFSFHFVLLFIFFLLQYNDSVYLQYSFFTWWPCWSFSVGRTRNTIKTQYLLQTQYLNKLLLLLLLFFFLCCVPPSCIRWTRNKSNSIQFACIHWRIAFNFHWKSTENQLKTWKFFAIFKHCDNHHK